MSLAMRSSRFTAVSRFQPVDKRCGMDLDCIDPVSIGALVAATEEYIQTQGPHFDSLTELLMKPFLNAPEVPLPLFCLVTLNESLMHPAGLEWACCGTVCLRWIPEVCCAPFWVCHTGTCMFF